MKNKILVLFALAVLGISGCKDAGTQPVEIPFNFDYPVADGVRAEYSIDSIDASGVNHFFGMRGTGISGSTILYSTPYFYQYDTLYTTTDVTTSISYIRKSANGVYYFIDTSAVNELIPDSLRPFIFTDPEMVFYSYPFEAGRNWNVFKFVAGNISIISFTADYAGKESLSLRINNSDTTLSAYKINYNLKITIPDSTFALPESNFSASFWLADSVGLVRMKGSKVFLSLFTGAVFDISDTGGQIEQKITAFRRP